VSGSGGLGSLTEKWGEIHTDALFIDEVAAKSFLGSAVSATDFIFKGRTGTGTLTTTIDGNGEAVFSDTITAPRFTGRVNASTISTAPPSDAEQGDLWWDDSLGNMFVYYDDGDSQQWVSTVSEVNLDEYVTLNTNQTITGTKTFIRPAFFDAGLTSAGDITCANLITNDVIMSNMGCEVGNEVDGTQGHWVI